MSGTTVNPKPDPWGPPGANAAQATSIATGATGAALLLGSEPPSGQSLLMLPDPTRIFDHAARVLGFQLDLSNLWTWGLILVVLSVALNVYSLFLRYRYARWVEPRWNEQIPRLEREAELGRKAAAGKTGGT